MQNEIQKQTIQKMEDAFKHTQNKIKKVRTGLAHNSVLEGIMVSSYGSVQELKHIASISCPDTRSFMISPWDQNVLKDIETAITKSNLGMAPQIDGKVIRLKVPELTEERRIQLIRAFKKDIEKARIEFRQIRKTMNEKVKKALKEKQISEDRAKDIEAEIQEQTDKFIKNVNELSDKKQQELTQV